MDQMPMDVALRHAPASVTKMLKTRPLLLAMNNSSIIFVLLRTDENHSFQTRIRANREKRELNYGKEKMWKSCRHVLTKWIRGYAVTEYPRIRVSTYLLGLL